MLEKISAVSRMQAATPYTIVALIGVDIFGRFLRVYYKKLYQKKNKHVVQAEYYNKKNSAWGVPVSIGTA